MKACAICKERISQDDGTILEDGRFACLGCEKELEEKGGQEECPECGEASEELKTEKVCPSCGAEAEPADDEETDD